ncbi:MAG: alpha/beta fold hydrolase [Caldilineaceae bacterium]|nr:alpha/beta fold hydrolase [Caldilineaceae bacterium]
MKRLLQTQRLFCSVLVAVFALVLVSTPRPVAAQSPVCAADVLVQSGDTLSAIAARELGNLNAYPQIVAATNAAAAVDSRYAAIDNPARINVGWRLCLPGAGTPAATPATAPASAPASAPSATPAPEATDDFVFDGDRLTIDYLRSLEFPGSELVIQETLAPGVNYARYVAAYQSDGLTILGLLTVPNGDTPAAGWPAIIFNHGYIPPEVYRTTERYVAYQDGFARNGYVTFKPDYRGHGFSQGEAFSAYGTPDYAVDVLNATATIKQLDYVDPARIGMWGHSMGGYLTVRAMVTDPEIKVGVIWAGVVASYPDIIERWTRSYVPSTIPTGARRWRQQLQDTYGTPAENPTFWASVSANSYLDDLSGPIQLHHGTADDSVPILFSQLLRDEIEAVGGTVDFYSYAGDDHNLSQQFNTAMSRSIAYFDQYLK